MGRGVVKIEGNSRPPKKDLARGMCSTFNGLLSLGGISQQSTWYPLTHPWDKSEDKELSLLR